MLLSLLVTGGVYPFFTVSVTTQLVGPADQEAWALLRGDAPFEEIKKEIVETGKQVDQIISRGDSFLTEAVYKKRKDVVVWLLKQGASPNGLRPSSPPLFYAVSNGDVKMIHLLLEYGADPDFDMGEGMTPRSVATLDENESVIQALQYVPKKAKTPSNNLKDETPLEEGI